MREWTVMLYFAGENRLYNEMVYQLKDLKRVNPDPKRLALLAEFGARRVKKADVTSTNLPTPRRFHLVTDDEHPAHSVAMNLVTDLPTTRPVTTYVDEIVDFIVWGIRAYPAKRYMVVFGGDGGGVLADFLPSTSKPPRSIRPRQLSTVFRQVRAACGDELNSGKVDIVGLDACLMSMTEICYGLREYANYLVSSEGNEDDLGWPYTDVFQVLKDRPDMSAIDLASQVVHAYNRYYLDYALIAGASGTLSTVDLTRIDALADAVSNFTAVAKPLLPIDQDFEQLELPQQVFVGLLIHAHWVSQTYRQDQYTDVRDFFTTLRDETIQITPTHGELHRTFGPIIGACELILNALGPDESSQTAAIVSSCNVGVKYQYSTGLSVYLPWSRVEETYYEDRHNEDWSADKPQLDAFALFTGWGDFIQRYVHLSRRPPKNKRVVSDGKLNGGIAGFVRLDAVHSEHLQFSLEQRPVFRTASEMFEHGRRDPPEGRGTLPVEQESAKNPPARWDICDCLVKPLRGSEPKQATITTAPVED